MPDGGVGFGQTEEGPLAQSGQDEALGDQHASFDLGFIPRAAHTGGNDGGTVVVGALRIRRVQIGFVTAGFTDSGTQIIRDHAMGNGTEITESADMRADPVLQLLGPGRFGIGQVAIAHDADKYLRLTDLAGGGIDNVQGRAAVIDEKLIPGAVFLAHGTIQGLAPLPIEFAELAVLVAGGLTLFVFLPQQHEGEVLVAAQFVMQRVTVGLRQLAGRGWLGGG